MARPRSKSDSTPAWQTPRGRAALRRLMQAFQRNGYWRAAPQRESQPETHRGYECRFSALTAAERDEIVRLLRTAGIRPGRPFAKGPSWRIPVYGREQTLVLNEAFSKSKSAR